MALGGMVAQGITIKFGANTSGLTDGAKQAQDVIGGFAKVGAVALLAVGAAFVAGGVASVKMAGDFQSSMTTLVTGAGEAQSNIKMVSSGILQMAVDAGTSTDQLSAGMYMIESAGFHGAAGLDVLKAAAEGAKVGNADLGVTAKAVTAEMINYKDSNLTATDAVNTLIATVSSGQTTMGDLSGAMAAVLPIASKAGVSLTDVSAAMATMTAKAVPAADAATYLRQTIMAIENPTKAASTEMTKMGLKSSDVAAEMKKSLPDALQMITDAAGKKFPVGSADYIAAISKMVGGTKSMQGIMNLTGSDMATFKANVDTISSAVKKGGDSVKGWSNVQQDFNFKVSQGKEVLETTGIKIGTALLPSVGKLLDKVIPLVTQFGDWLVKSGTLKNAVDGLGNAVDGLATALSGTIGFFQQNQWALQALQTIILPVAGVIGGLLVYALVAATIAAWGMAVAVFAATWEFILVGAIIGAVVAIIVLAFQHWGDITKWFQGVWGAVCAWLAIATKATGAFFVSVWQAVASFFIGIWDGIISGLKAAWAFIVNVVKIGAQLVFDVLFAPIIAIVALFGWLYNHNYYFKALVDAIVNFFKGCFSWCMDQWHNFIGWLETVWQGIVNTATTVWNDISDAVKTGFFAAVGFVSWIWGIISSFFVNAWNTYIAKPLTALWTNVSHVFATAWNTYIAGPLSGIWNSVSKWFTDLGANAGNAGKNFINMLVDGIKSGAGAIWNAVVGIANTIWKALGFHSPPEAGPASDSDTWMPNLISMLTKGMNAGMPAMQKAASNLAQPLALSFGNPNYASLAGGKAMNAGNAATPIVVQVQPNDVYIDGKKMTDVVASRLASGIRMQGVKSR